MIQSQNIKSFHYLVAFSFYFPGYKVLQNCVIITHYSDIKYAMCESHDFLPVSGYVSDTVQGMYTVNMEHLQEVIKIYS